MQILLWNEAVFMDRLNSGLYEDLIEQVEHWAEESYIICRSKVPRELNYATARRATALGIIAQEGKRIYDADSSNYYDSYTKIIERIEEKRRKGLIYKVKGYYGSSSSSSTSSGESSSGSSASSGSTSGQTKSGNPLVGWLIFLLIAAIGVFLWMEVLTVKVYMVTDKTVEAEQMLHTTYEYDKVGRLVKLAELDAEGNMLTCTEYEFNSIGEPQGSITYTLVDGEQVVTARNVYETTPSFYITRDQQYDSNNNEISRISNVYKLNGLVEKTGVFIDDQAISKSTFEYDGKKLIKQTDYGYVDGEEYEQAVYEYSYVDDNRVSCKVHIEGILTSQVDYTYDGKLLTQEHIYHVAEDGALSLAAWKEYAYDDNGNLKKISEYADEQRTGYTEIICDENGNILETRRYSEGAEEAEMTVSYQYQEFRMRTSKANRLQRQRGEELVIIDKGLI